MAGADGAQTIRVRGLDEFRRELKKVDSGFGKKLRQVHLKIAALVAGASAAAAPERASGAIKPRATQKSAFVSVGPGRRGDAIAVIAGMRRRSGWYAKGRYRESTGKQFKPWIGNQYDPGDTGGKPYFIGDAINASLDEVADIYLDGLEDLAKQAFPS